MRTHRQGFSLIEVLVASAILAVAILGCVQILINTKANETLLDEGSAVQNWHFRHVLNFQDDGLYSLFTAQTITFSPTLPMGVSGNVTDVIAGTGATGRVYTLTSNLTWTDSAGNARSESFVGYQSR